MTPPPYAPPPPASGVTSISYLEPAELDFTHAGAAGTFFFIQISRNTASQRRQARRNELRIPSTVLAEAIVPRAASPQTWINALDRIGLPSTGPAWVGVRITSLSAGYLPGGSLFVPSIAVTYP